MDKYIEEIWTSFKNEVEYYKKKDAKLKFNEDKKADFEKNLRKLYKDIKIKYMNKNVKALDRHKVAAVSIVSAINSDIISYEKVSTGKVFVGAEMIATEVALSWMLQKLNEKLKDVEHCKTIPIYFMPSAFACDTPYFDIFSRNLYFAKEKYSLNPLDIAEKLFLLEYITLLKCEIEPEKLIEY